MSTGSTSPKKDPYLLDSETDAGSEFARVSKTFTAVYPLGLATEA